MQSDTTGALQSQLFSLPTDNHEMMQERMTQQIAQAIDKHLNPMGVFVIVHAVHYCMIQRGVRQTGSSTLTTARRGVFLKNPSLEEKLQRYLNMRIDSNQNL